MNLHKMTKDQLIKHVLEEHKKAEYLKSLENESLDLDKVCTKSLELMIKLENVDMAFIYMIDRNNNAVIKAHINIPEDYIKRAGVIPYPKGVTWKVLNEKIVLNLYDIQEDKDIGDAGKALGHHRALGIPIILDDKIMGVIWLASYKRGKFSDQEIELNVSIGNQIGVAIARANLYNELSKMNRYQKILSNITNYIHQSINLNEVMKNVVEALVDNIENVHNATIYMLDGEDVTLKVYHNLPDWFIKSVQKISSKKGLIWKTINEGKSIYVPDTDDEDVTIGSAGNKLGIKSYLSMPITDNHRTIGAISLTSSLKNVFDEEDVHLIKTVTKQIEIAISNANKADELKQAHAKLEKRVEERTVQLEEINSYLSKEIEVRKNAQNKIKVSEYELRKLAMHMQSIREEEILKISRELHDDLGQVLTSLNIEFSSLASKLLSEDNNGTHIHKYEVNSVKEIIESAIEKVQKISTELRPAILDALGLISAIEWHIQEFQTQTGIECEFRSSLDETIFNEKESIAIYRILQESMTNIIRHAKATRVKISLYKHAGSVILEITDNGIGIQKNKITSHKSIGLQGMHERALVLGGELNIKGVPDNGTGIRLLLPKTNSTLS